MKKVLLLVAILATTIASAQSAYLNVDAQHDDNYFTQGGINIGVSVLTPLDNVSDNLVAELGAGFFKDNADTRDYMKFNVLTGVGYVVDGKHYGKDSALILKANFRGYLINDNIKGYFEPTAELKFSDKFSINFAYASEIHPHGFNIPTGRIGIKSKF